MFVTAGARQRPRHQAVPAGRLVRWSNMSVSCRLDPPVPASVLFTNHKLKRSQSLQRDARLLCLYLQVYRGRASRAAGAVRSVRRRCGGGALGWSGLWCAVRAGPIPIGHRDLPARPGAVRVPDVADSARTDAVGVFHWSRGSPLAPAPAKGRMVRVPCCAVLRRALRGGWRAPCGARSGTTETMGGGARRILRVLTARTAQCGRDETSMSLVRSRGLVCEERDKIGGISRDLNIAFVVAGRRGPTLALLAAWGRANQGS